MAYKEHKLIEEKERKRVGVLKMNRQIRGMCHKHKNNAYQYIDAKENEDADMEAINIHWTYTLRYTHTKHNH